jgi:dihydrofolate reductase
MGLLTLSMNVTLDGCVDHEEGIADDEMHAFFTRIMDDGGAMLWGRITYEMMERYWPPHCRRSTHRCVPEWAAEHATARTSLSEAAPQRRRRHALPA